MRFVWLGNSRNVSNRCVSLQEELKKKLLKERDQEIEMIVSKFEEEATKSQNDLKKSYEEKIASLRERNATQLNDVRIADLFSDNFWDSIAFLFTNILHSAQGIRENLEKQIFGVGPNKHGQGQQSK